ncbi:hypothetical protein GCM10007416_14510 [Kroppenstedtia guangzhouensis]|uniref:Uncharacterized protein n=1 Tax=Kroppenstedtia guangzhouensis TaxID=1274356 RepID=A0ABQ1GFF7_9BACL|nr:hypothetical protein GCM10007416_14510 [Kroppenstedtia guangzhouensis]
MDNKGGDHSKPVGRGHGLCDGCRLRLCSLEWEKRESESDAESDLSGDGGNVGLVSDPRGKCSRGSEENFGSGRFS